MSNKTRDKLIEYVLIEGDVVNAIQERPYTAVRLNLKIDSQTYLVANGFSKVKYPDDWDEDFGYDLACQKAASKIVRQIMSDAELVNSILDKVNEPQTEITSNSL